MDIEIKRFIIENSGTNIEYVETVREDTVKTRAGEYEIPTSQLKLEVYAFRSGKIMDLPLIQRLLYMDINTREVLWAHLVRSCTLEEISIIR